MNKPIGRNDPCPCGSGRKFKHCCGRAASGGVPVMGRADDPARLHQEAIRLFQTGHGATALAQMQRVLGLHPDYVAAHYDLGVMQQMLGRHEEAVACYRRTIELEPGHGAAWNNLGSALEALERYDEAADSYRRALDLQPGHAEAHNNLGRLLRGMGKAEEAVDHFRAAIEARPGYADALVNLGAALLENQDALEAAETVCRQAVAAYPASAEAWNNLGHCLQKQEKIEQAVAAYQRAVAINPDLVQSWLNMGEINRDLHNAETAVKCYQEVLRLEPDHVAALAGMGAMQILLGKFDEAVQSLERVLDFVPDSLAAYGQLVQARKLTADDRELIGRIEGLLDAQQAGEERKGEVDLHYALGKVHDDMKDYPRAFEHYRRANDLEKAKSCFDREQLVDVVDRTIEQFTPAFYEQYRGLGSDSDVPILIVGTPRSGTTLTEQIIASHPAVAGAGEVMFWAKSQAYLWAHVARPGRDWITEVEQGYLKVLRHFGPDARHVTDKMPGNFMNLGFIHLAFPRARIIHTRRNPVDACLSIYFQHFPEGHTYAHDLEDLAFWYQQYRRLMAHWRRVLPSEVFYENQYEELVADQETLSRRLIEFCGLPWDERCLEFHKTERTIATASKWQVRQPIYKTSRERWRNYEPWIGPLLKLLEPVGPDI